MIFTSTDCSTCVEAMRTVGGVSAPIREVTWELEPHLFDQYHVEAVPLIVVLDRTGRSTMFETGAPRRSRYAKAVRAAGITRENRMLVRPDLLLTSRGHDVRSLFIDPHLKPHVRV